MSKATKTPEIEPLSDFGKQLAAVLEMAGPWEDEGKPTFTDLLTQAMHKHAGIKAQLAEATSRATKAESRAEGLEEKHKAEVRDLLASLYDDDLHPLSSYCENEFKAGINHERKLNAKLIELKARELGVWPLSQSENAGISAAPTPPPSSPAAASDKHSDTCPTIPGPLNQLFAGSRPLTGEEYQVLSDLVDAEALSATPPDFYPKEVFDSAADYDASVARNIERIKSGDVKPITHQENEENG